MKKKKIVVLGAGISGLALVWYLKQYFGLQVQLTIFEKSHRTGGWVETIEKEGFLFEQGPRSCRTWGHGRTTLALIESLGLESEVIFPSKESQHRYIYTERGLQQLPSRLWEIPFSQLMRGWPQALWRDLRMPKRAADDETVADFFSRRVGGEWVDRLIDPFVSGIYAGDIRRLSMKSCFPEIDEMEQHRRSLVLSSLFSSKKKSPHSPFIQQASRHSLFSFKGGLRTLVKALEDKLTGCLFLNRTVDRIEFHENTVDIFLESGEKLEADHVISTIPAYGVSHLLRSAYPSLSRQLNELRYTSLKAINLGYRHLKAPLHGFGYLVPSRLECPVLGCIWDSSIFPEQNHSYGEGRLTVILGGEHHPEVDTWDNDKLIDTALTALQEQCGIWAVPDTIHIQHIPQAIPQYEVGHQKWKQRVLEKMMLVGDRLTLSGTAFHGVSINDCIHSASKSYPFIA